MTNAADRSAAEDERQIRALLARLFEAWERGDGEAYAACFTEDCDYITFNGVHLRGRAENSRLHGALFRTVLRGSRLEAEVENIELLARRCADAHRGPRAEEVLPDHVLTKVDGHWLIKSFQNTKVQPFSVWMTRLMQGRQSG